MTSDTDPKFFLAAISAFAPPVGTLLVLLSFIVMIVIGPMVSYHKSLNLAKKENEALCLVFFFILGKSADLGYNSQDKLNKR